MSFKRMDLLLQELGRNEDIPDLHLDESGACAIRMAMPEAPVINMYYLEADNRFVMLAEVGYIPTSHETGLMRSFLIDNLAWAGADGAVFAIAPDTGKLILQRRDDADALTPKKMADNFRTFLDAAIEATGRIAIVEDDADNSTPQDADNTAARPDGMIRV